MIGYPDVKDHWQAELDKTNRAGLIDMIDTLATIGSFSRELLLSVAKSAKDTGKHQQWFARHEREKNDPDKYEARRLRKRAATLMNRSKKKGTK